MGSQHDASDEDQELDLYVNVDQKAQTLKIIDSQNKNVNVLLKSDATHEGYNETNYGG